jgi:RNA polymerase sigma-32 factor
LRLVIKIARGFRGYGLPIADLIAEGNVGLMQAAQKFDPDRGFRFATYAMWRVRAAIQEHILHSTSIVKMGTTAAQKKLFFNLRQLKGRLEQFEPGDLPPESVATIAAELGVPEKDVIEMNRRMSRADGSLNEPVLEDGEIEWLDRLVDERPSQETVVAEADELTQRRKLLGEAMAQLNAREREILVERRLRDEPLTLEDLSRRFHVSRERIRQLEVRAVDKLRKGGCSAPPTRWARLPTSPQPEQRPGPLLIGAKEIPGVNAATHMSLSWRFSRRSRLVDLVRAGRSPEELAREFEPTAQSIRNWLAQSERNAGRGDGGLTTAEREELNRTS